MSEDGIRLTRTIKYVQSHSLEPQTLSQLSQPLFIYFKIGTSHDTTQFLNCVMVQIYFENI